MTGAGGFGAVLRLCRVEYVGFGYLAIQGALAEAGLALSWGKILALLAANLLFVAWTFAHNDLCDLPVDRRAAALDLRVLVRGDLSRGQAKALIVLLMAAMFAITLFGLGIPATLGFAAASLLAIGYDLVSKRVLGSDLLFAASAACCALAGVLAVADWRAISPLGCSVVAFWFVESLFFNAIEGGIKDVTIDRDAGVVTLAQRLVRTEGDAIQPSPAFLAIAFLLKLGAIGLALGPALTGDDVATSGRVAIAAAGLLALVFTWRFLAHRRYDWFAMAKDLMPIEMASRLLMPLLLQATGRIGWGVVALFFFVPAAWYTAFARLVHARGFALPKRF